jgi:hypothetical protein
VIHMAMKDVIISHQIQKMRTICKYISAKIQSPHKYPSSLTILIPSPSSNIIYPHLQPFNLPDISSPFPPHTTSPRKQQCLRITSIEPLHPPLLRLPAPPQPRHFNIHPIPPAIALGPHTLCRRGGRVAVAPKRRGVAGRN